MGRGCWKMNTDLIREERIQNRMRQKLALWKQHKRYYPWRNNVGFFMSKSNFDTSLVKRKQSGATTSDRWKTIIMNAYITSCAAACPRKTNYPSSNTINQGQ
jgi:hypothetical protein